MDPRSAAPSRTIVFAHANGFPAGTYRVLFERWRAAGYTVHAPERFGHDPRYPVGPRWSGLRDELLDFVAGTGQAPVLLVGHSLGGLLSMLAASHRPALCAGVVLLDSPLITGWRAQVLHAIKRVGLVQRLGPGQVSIRRRHAWPDRDAALAHFQSKPVFARWDPRVLRDYVDAGTEGHGSSEVRLRFEREVETRIYNSLPHHLGPLLRRHPLRCPVGFIAGTQSAEMRQGGDAASRRLAGERFVRFEGSHLFPMERPEATAELILRLFQDFEHPGALSASPLPPAHPEAPAV
ncbi:alpha/beta hydrolase [Ideonella sp. 4Y16]|uniref:alpha/beta fold hydrolase n=1 Tax=Ideonella alba TaxID=2824118 RepID=UPI001B382507|nr:alpha/beta hydrolase [Ideonella alba]MBQ0944843.1 alpha/beta hydrolase [Ideonella alba]